MNNSNNSISQWHIFISGYTQSRQQSTGLQKAYLAATTYINTSYLNDRDAATEYIYKQAETVFFPVLPWSHDWYTLARFIQINSNSAKPPLINIYAYSWGAGHGAIKLSQYLQSIAQYDIQNMVLADPVYCSSNPLMRWRAVFASRFESTRFLAPRITIPTNTKHVYWSRQFNNWPRAHALYSPPASKTIIHPSNLEQSLIHAEMDESPWFQNKVAELCNQNA